MSWPDIAPGTTFGRLTVISSRQGQHNSGRICTCRCSCGQAKEVRAVDLRRGLIMSCSGQHPCALCGRMVIRLGEASHIRRCKRDAARAA